MTDTIDATNEDRVKALALYLKIGNDDIEPVTYDEKAFEAEGCEYLVLTDDEADERATDYIKDSLWAFNASFLSGFTGLPEEVFTALQDKCEDANETFLELIEGFGRSSGPQTDNLETFVQEAMSADGRGHFMSSYDGEENEIDIMLVDSELDDDKVTFFIYRTN